MKLTVVDSIYLEGEHIKRLQSIGDIKIFKGLAKNSNELKKRIDEANIVIAGWSNLNRDVISSTEKLEMISLWATTCHYVDLEAARERGIVVTHVPSYATEAVAEHAFGLLLASVRRVPLADKNVRKGKFDWRPLAGIELAGKTLGVVGTGSIGCRVAEIGIAFRMQILGFDKYPNMKRAGEIGIKYVDFQTLLRESDIISLHVPLISETRSLIGRKEIAVMKNGAVIINTSQGRIIDEKALVDALKSGKLRCAGLDVFEDEPPAKDNPLLKLDNVTLSPHCGFCTVEAVKRCTDICIDNVIKFSEGNLQNVCQI